MRGSRRRDSPLPHSATRDRAENHLERGPGADQSGVGSVPQHAGEKSSNDARAGHGLEVSHVARHGPVALPVVESENCTPAQVNGAARLARLLLRATMGGPALMQPDPVELRDATGHT